MHRILSFYFLENFRQALTKYYGNFKKKKCVQKFLFSPYTIMRTHNTALCKFSSSPYKTEVMMTSLIEMPELPKFGHMNKSTI